MKKTNAICPHCKKQIDSISAESNEVLRITLFCCSSCFSVLGRWLVNLSPFRCLGPETKLMLDSKHVRSSGAILDDPGNAGFFAEHRHPRKGDRSDRNDYQDITWAL